MNDNTPVDSRPSPDFGALVPYLPHCAVMLVLDTSHSMYKGTALADLHRSIKAFFASLAGNSFSGARVRVAAVGMGDDLRLLDNFRPCEESRLPGMRIRPKGDTPVGGALRLALAEVDAEERRMRGMGAKVAPSQIILLSDGVSTDDFSREATEIRTRVAAGRLVAKTIALGPNADRAALERISGGAAMDPSGTDMAGTFSAAGAEVSRSYSREAAASLQSAPGVDSANMFSRRFLVDGTNMLYWDVKRTGIRLDFVLALARALKAKGADYRVFFDASTPYKLRDGGRPGDEQTYQKMLDQCPDRFVQVPAGVEADEFLLMEGDGDSSAVVVSDDLFRDRAGAHPWIKEPGRRMAGMVSPGGDLLFAPGGLRVPVA